MLSPWHLPVRAGIGGREYPIHTDFRDILEIFSYFEDPELPEYLRWRIALALFYPQQPPKAHRQEAMEYLARFINGGAKEPERPGPRLLDWRKDAPLIVADINRLTGQEIRALPYVHWWTFLSWFRGVGQGQLSTVVAIRDKIARGKKLEDWEKSFYQENKDLVELKKPYTRQELAQKQALLQQLG